MELREGDIVQIVDEEHHWFPALVVVSEPKAWGLQGYAFIPSDSGGSAFVYIRLETKQVEKVGEVVIGRWIIHGEEE